MRGILHHRIPLRKGDRPDDLVGRLTSDWFPEQRAFYDDPSQLVAAIKGRRAGGTRGGAAHFVRRALALPGFRGLYLNSTRGEAERLAWWGLKSDGMASLVERLKIPCDTNGAKLELRFENGSWIFLRGADDEAELRKALGFAYHEVWWDEAQKIPPKIAPAIREVLMPALLDDGGRLRLVGTPVRQMAGLFWEVTRPEIERRIPGWSVHHWTLLENPFFGPDRERRWAKGVLGLQRLLGGPDVAPIDSPIMRREALGEWVREDANYVYAVHRAKHEGLFYAPARLRPDGFPDVATALDDLPWPKSEAMFALGIDIGYFPDPFAFALWAWHPNHPELHEVCSWTKTRLTSDEQVAAVRAVREHVAIGIVVADAGGPAKGTVRGWSKEWVDRYGLPIVEAEKAHKHVAIDTVNADLIAGNLKLRDGGALYDEMKDLQWSSVVSGSGRMVEDPTLANHACDAALYAHRHSWQHRYVPAVVEPPPGTPERAVLEEQRLEQDRMDELDEEWLH